MRRNVGKPQDSQLARSFFLPFPAHDSQQNGSSPFLLAARNACPKGMTIWTLLIMIPGSGTPIIPAMYTVDLRESDSHERSEERSGIKGSIQDWRKKWAEPDCLTHLSESSASQTTGYRTDARETRFGHSSLAQLCRGRSFGCRSLGRSGIRQ